MDRINAVSSSTEISVIPASELILHTEPYKSRLTEAIAWAEQNLAQVSDLKEFAKSFEID